MSVGFVKKIGEKKTFKKTAKPQRNVIVRKYKFSKVLNRLRKKNSRTPIGL